MTGNLFAELQRRNVIRMAGLYLVGAWLLVQVAGTVLPMFDVPSWVARALVIVLALAFLPALAFAWIFELTPDGLKRDSEVPAEHSIGPQTARRMDRMLLGALVLALLYFALDKFVLAPGRQAALVAQATQAAQVAAATTPATAHEPSIAVLPFANLSSDAEQAYFSDGLSGDLITALSQFSGLKVVSSNSSFRFRDSKVDTRTIGTELGVLNLLTGSVRRAGNQVRISADLVNVADGRTVWSQRYDRPYDDLFKLQDEITAAVAEALKARLLDAPGAVAQSDRPPSGSLDAYNAYLQGRFHVNRGLIEDFDRAIVLFGQAVALDPAYAHALAALASARVLRAAQFDGGEAARVAVARSREELDRALALAPDLAFAHIVNARVLMNGELRWVESERESRLARTLAPNDALALGALGQARGALGDAFEAEALLRQSLQLDPLSVTSWYWLSVTLASSGQLDEADEAMQRSRSISPNSHQSAAQHALIKALRGQYREAMAIAEAMPDGSWRRIALAVVSQRAGDAAIAERALQTLIDEHGDSAAFQLAEAYAFRGQPDPMFDWLERAWTNRDPGLRRTLLDPFLAPYRGDPRFAVFCRKIGLPIPE